MFLVAFLLCVTDVWVFDGPAIINTRKGRVYDGVQRAQPRQQVKHVTVLPVLSERQAISILFLSITMVQALRL